MDKVWEICSLVVGKLGIGRLETGDLSVFDLELDGFITLCANGFDGRVAVERGGDAEHVPGAIGEIDFSIRMDFEICRHT